MIFLGMLQTVNITVYMYVKLHVQQYVTLLKSRIMFAFITADIYAGWCKDAGMVSFSSACLIDVQITEGTDQTSRVD